jgi:nicotinamidase/pyrazinamidase
MISCQVAPWQYRVVTRSSHLQMNCSRRFDLVVATKDWHPRDHGSFAANHPGKKPGDRIILDGIEQILWPVHCVQNTQGADFAPLSDTSRIAHVFHKGTERNIDSYSTFFDNAHRRHTGLAHYLEKRGIKNIYLMGLAVFFVRRRLHR